MQNAFVSVQKSGDEVLVAAVKHDLGRFDNLDVEK